MNSDARDALVDGLERVSTILVSIDTFYRSNSSTDQATEQIELKYPNRAS